MATKNKDTRDYLISLISSELTVKAGTIIKNNDIIGKVTAGGVKVDGSSSFVMTGGEIYGCYDYDMGQVYVAKGGQFTMTGGTIRSVCTEGNATIGGSAKITSYFRLNGVSSDAFFCLGKCNSYLENIGKRRCHCRDSCGWIHFDNC